MVVLNRIARKTLSDEVFDQLSREIVHGRMPPGDALPAERELVSMLGVNRGAVREALKRLAQAGLVSIQQGGGTTVLDYRRSGGLDLLSRLLFGADGDVDLDVARSVMEMRAALAPDIARLCARRGGAAAAQELHAIVEKMTEAGSDLEVLQALSLDYWDALVRGGANIAYELAFNTLRETYEHIRGALVLVMADEVRDIDAYQSIAQAVSRGDDVAARHVASALVEHGTHRMFELIVAMQGDDGGARKAGNNEPGNNKPARKKKESGGETS